MKIICFEHNFSKKYSTQESDGFEGSGATVYLKPDTALLRNNDTFYIPNSEGEIGFSIAIVIKISKIGKAITQKFANRYYNELTLGVNFVATDILKKAVALGKPWDVAVGFDHSFATGVEFIDKQTFFDTENKYVIVNQKIEFFVNDTLIENSYIEGLLELIDTIVSRVSHSFTLKIGDYIAVCAPFLEKNIVKSGDNFRGGVCGSEVLNFVVK